MAPEVLKRDGPFCVVVADLWSVGVVFLEVLLGHHPFGTAHSESHLLRMQRDLDISQFSPRVQEIILVILNHDPAKRTRAFRLIGERNIPRERRGSTEIVQLDLRKRHSISRSKTLEDLNTIANSPGRISPARAGRSRSPQRSNSPKNPVHA